MRPARVFDDVAAVLGPRKLMSSVCWCLSHRLDAATHRYLAGPARGALVRELVEQPRVAPTDSVSGGFPRVLVRRWP